MASRAVDALITYRIVKLLTTPFEKQEAFKYGIIDKDGKVLKTCLNYLSYLYSHELNDVPTDSRIEEMLKKLWVEQLIY